MSVQHAGDYPIGHCNCGAYMSIIPPPPCPAHTGAAHWVTPYQGLAPGFGGEGRVDELERRIAELERRLAEQDK